MSTAEIGLARMAFGLAKRSDGEALDNERTQVGIDATMREVIGAANYNPNHFEPPSKSDRCRRRPGCGSRFAAEEWVGRTRAAAAAAGPRDN